MSTHADAAAPAAAAIPLQRRVRAAQKPPRLKRPQEDRCDTRERYELAMGAYAIQRDEKRKQHHGSYEC